MRFPRVSKYCLTALAAVALLFTGFDAAALQGPVRSGTTQDSGLERVEVDEDGFVYTAESLIFLAQIYDLAMRVPSFFVDMAFEAFQAQYPAQFQAWYSNTSNDSPQGANDNDPVVITINEQRQKYPGSDVWIYTKGSGTSSPVDVNGQSGVQVTVDEAYVRGKHTGWVWLPFELPSDLDSMIFWTDGEWRCQQFESGETVCSTGYDNNLVCIYYPEENTLECTIMSMGQKVCPKDFGYPPSIMPPGVTPNMPDCGDSEDNGKVVCAVPLEDDEGETISGGFGRDDLYCGLDEEQ